MIKDKHQYHVCGWMINQLHLEGRELQCYAIIYSLSQLGEGRYIAGLKFLAEFMQCSQPTASSAVKGLFKKELIKKDEVVNEYGRRVFYYCADPDIEEVDKSDEGGEKENDEGVNKKFMDGVNKKFMPKYNNINKLNNKNKEKDKTSTTSSPMRENDYLSNEEKELMNDESYQELIAMRYHLTTEGVKDKITDFIIECRCNGIEMHQNSTDLRSHFNNWLRIQQNGNDRKSNKQRNDGESATERFIRVFGGNTPEHAGDTQGEHIKGSPFVD